MLIWSFNGNSEWQTDHMHVYDIASQSNLSAAKIQVNAAMHPDASLNTLDESFAWCDRSMQR